MALKFVRLAGRRAIVPTTVGTQGRVGNQEQSAGRAHGETVSSALTTAAWASERVHLEGTEDP